MIIPSLIFISKLACPLTLTPWISDPYKLQSIYLSDLLDTVSMIKKNSRVTHSFFGLVVLIFNSVCTSKKEALLMILLQVFPELTSFNRLCNFGRSKMELLRNTTSQIDKGFIHLSSMQHLVSSMELCVCFLH
jgi:precorrin-3B methylase